MKETENIDKLFLELSQFTQAETGKELELKNILRSVLVAWQDDGVKKEHCVLFNRAWFKVNNQNAENREE